MTSSAHRNDFGQPSVPVSSSSSFSDIDGPQYRQHEERTALIDRERANYGAADPADLGERL